MQEDHRIVDELITHRTRLPDGRFECRALALCETPDKEEAFAGSMWCKEHGRVYVESEDQKAA